MNRLRMQHRADLTEAEREIERSRLAAKKLVESIMDGVPASEVREPLLHPRMSDIYRMKVEGLADALEHNDDQQRGAAREALRGFVTAIVIPAGDGLLTVRGDLGKMLEAAASGANSVALASVAYGGCGGGI